MARKPLIISVVQIETAEVGSDVVVTENGKAEAVLPEHIHMDPLTDTGKLRIDGSRYYLAT